MDYLLFFFVFFFFAMTLFLGVGVELRQGWFKLRVDRCLDLPGSSPPYQLEAWHRAGSRRNEKAQIVLIFPEFNGYSDCD